MVPLLVTSVVCIVGGIWILRAYLRGEHHVAARLAAVISLTQLASICYRAYRGESNALVAAMLAAFLLTMFSLAVAKGPFHAPPR